MQPAKRNLADEIIRLVEMNRAAINALEYGEISFRAHQSRLIEVTAAKTLKLSAGLQLCLLPLKCEDYE